MIKTRNGPRLTPELIDSAIAKTQFHVFEGSCLTVCCMTLKNGFTVAGESVCASPANFDAEIGQKIARDNVRNKLWMPAHAGGYAAINEGLGRGIQRATTEGQLEHGVFMQMVVVVGILITAGHLQHSLRQKILYGVVNIGLMSFVLDCPVEPGD